MRFAVLHHDHLFAHWDLLLEAPDGCWTWRLLDSPDKAFVLRAERIANHRPFYLDYEGPVSGNRGSVFQSDAGAWVWITATDSRVMGWATGRHWCGRIVLSADSAGSWLLTYQPVEKKGEEPVEHRPSE